MFRGFISVADDAFINDAYRIGAHGWQAEAVLKKMESGSDSRMTGAEGRVNMLYIWLQLSNNFVTENSID